MKRVAIQVCDKQGDLVSDQERLLDIGSGRLDEIEQALKRPFIAKRKKNGLER